MSRDGADADHEAIRDVPAVILREPSVGDLFQVYFDDGKVLRTSAVKRVAREGTELRIETANSTYRMRAA